MKIRAGIYKGAALVMMSTFLFCGCGSQSTTTSGKDDNTRPSSDVADIIPEETLTLTVFSQTANYSGEQIGWLGQVLKEKFNVKLNIVPDPDESAYATRMEAGDLGDIVLWGSNGDKYLNAIDKGLLLDWNEDDLLAVYGGYIKEHMQAALQKNTDISGGTVYGIGNEIGVNSTDISSFTYGWCTRWDLYKELGYPEMKDMDDFADTLIDMQKLAPEDESGKKTYAVSLFSDWDGDMVMFPKSMVTAYYGYDEFGMGFYDSKTQAYIPAVAEDSPYVDMLKFYNKLYQNGALDPDSETQGFDGCAEDYRNGIAYFTPFSFIGSDIYNSKEHLAENKAMYTVLPDEATPINYGQSIYGANYVWSIGSNTEYPELCMSIINWYATPEGKMTQLYGPKDVCWYYDENGKAHFTELGLSCTMDGKTNMTDGYSGLFKDGQDQVNGTTWALDAVNLDSDGETYNWKHWESNRAEATTEIEKDWRDKMGAASTDEYLASRAYTLCPGTTYSPTPKSDELTVVWNQVKECVKNYSWKAIYASSDEDFEKTIQEMITTAGSYG